MRRVLNSQLSVVCVSFLACMWLMASVLCFDAPVSGATEVSGERCPTAPTRDFSASMRHFPAIRHVPSDGNLPFGPTATALSSLSDSVQAGSGRLGFRLTLSRQPPLKRRLRWQMELHVMKLDARGNERSLVAHRKTTLGLDQKLGKGEALVSAPVSSASAFFRLDIAIRKRNGHTLGRYSEYVRVVPPRVNVKLLISADALEPNDVILSRIQNRGTVAVAHEPRNLRLERRTRSGWRNVRQDTSSSNSAPSARVGIVPGGALSSCNGRRIPSDAIPGTYRLYERVTAPGHSRTLRAEFQVR
jgi:hypothetical protein